MNMTRIQGIRFTEAQWQVIKERAQLCGLALSTYLRQVGLGSTPWQRRTEVGDQVLYHLSRIGNKLSQIARSLNSGIPVPTSEIRESVARIDDCLSRNPPESRLVNI